MIPSNVIGRLRTPLLKPNQNEREGYVPNVVYTCGALVHNGELVMPYGMADHSTGFATVPLHDVLGAMNDVVCMGPVNELPSSRRWRGERLRVNMELGRR